MRFRFALLSLVASAAVAQTTPNYTTTITLASLLSGSAKVPSAQVCATPANAYGNPIAVSAPTWGLILPSAPLCASVTAGLLTNGLPVPDANHTNLPFPIYYNISIQTLDSTGKPNAAPVLLNKVPNVSGTTYALDSYAPTTAFTMPASNTLGGGPGTPSTCFGLSLWLRNDNTLFGCQNGVYSQISGVSGGAVTPFTLAIGTVSTGLAGTSASVVNVGTSSAPLLNFTIPAGQQGPIGPNFTVNGKSQVAGNLQLAPADLGALPVPIGATAGHAAVFGAGGLTVVDGGVPSGSSFTVAGKTPTAGNIALAVTDIAGAAPLTNPTFQGVVTAPAFKTVPTTNGMIQFPYIGVADPAPPAETLQIDAAGDPGPTGFWLHESVTPCAGFVTSTTATQSGVPANTRGCGQALVAVASIPACPPTGSTMYLNYAGRVAMCQGGTLTNFQLGAYTAPAAQTTYTDPMTGTGPLNSTYWTAAGSGLNYSSTGAVPASGTAGTVYSAGVSYGATQTVTATLVGGSSGSAGSTNLTLYYDTGGDYITWLFLTRAVVVGRAGVSGNTQILGGCPVVSAGQQAKLNYSGGQVLCANNTLSQASAVAYTPSWAGVPAITVDTSTTSTMALSGVTVGP